MIIYLVIQGNFGEIPEKILAFLIKKDAIVYCMKNVEMKNIIYEAKRLNQRFVKVSDKLCWHDDLSYFELRDLEVN